MVRDLGNVLGVGMFNSDEAIIILLRNADDTCEKLTITPGIPTLPYRNSLISERLTSDEYLDELENLPRPYIMVSTD